MTDVAVSPDVDRQSVSNERQQQEDAARSVSDAVPGDGAAIVFDPVDRDDVGLSALREPAALVSSRISSTTDV